MYLKGEGVKQDFTKAKEWFEKATEQHHMSAQAVLGSMYFFGYGIDKNKQKGKELIEESALSGDPIGQFYFGVLYEEAEPQKTYKGIEKNIDDSGFYQDFVKAREWYEKAAQQGNIQATYNLGVLYANGRGVEKDEFKARKYYEIAAKGGDRHAKHNLAIMYYNGYAGLTKDLAKGVKLDIEAAKQGSPLAQYNLGLFFYEGTYFKQDYTKARKSFEFAAAQNEAGSQYMLAIIYEQGLGVDKDPERAKHYYYLACQNGYEESCTQANAN